MKKLVLSLLLTVFLLPVANAGDFYAVIHGTVTDVSGANVAGAVVTLSNVGTGQSLNQSTNRDGYYVFPRVNVGGPFTLRIAAARFQPFVTTSIYVAVNNDREFNAVLEVGTASETVEVRAAALQVETANTQLQQTVTAMQLQKIPLEGRDPAGLQKLHAGVMESSDRFGTFASNGSETAQNSYLVDGIDINDPMLQREGIQINPDALAEENIVTSTMNAQFARNSGAVVNQIVKTGTNSLHGSAFEFYRDTFLNNGDYFSRTRPDFHQNLYGGTIGGPAIKNRMFFFGAYQGMRNRVGQTSLQTTLTSDQLNGDFSNDVNYAVGAPNLAGLSDNPIPFNISGCAANSNEQAQTWSQCFSGGSVNIPRSRWNPIADLLVQKYVLPANEILNGVSYANFNSLNTNVQDQGIFRVDYTPTSNDTFWFTSVIQSSPGTTTLTFGGSSFPGAGSLQANHFKMFNAAWNHTYGAHVLNELRGSYFRNPYGAFSPAHVESPASAGFQIHPQDPLSGLPYITIGSYFNLGFSYQGPQPRLDTNETFTDNLMWVRGQHSFRFGGSFEQFRVRNPFDVFNNGSFGFQGGTQGGGKYSSGDPLIDFVMGIPDTYYQTNNGLINAVATEFYGYLQDSWKSTSDLTLTYGLGWDVEKPYQNQQDGGRGVVCWQNNNKTSLVFPNGPPGLGWPGDPGCNSAGSPVAHYDKFGPRVGFAWAPSSGPALAIGQRVAHELSIRGGFGVYYNRDQEEQSLQNLQDPPFMHVSTGAAAFGGSPSFANPFADVAGNESIANPFPYAPIRPKTPIEWGPYLPLQLATFSPASAVPYTYNFNLNLQRALGSKAVAQVGYVGSVSHRLATWYEGDNITPAGHDACLLNPMCVKNRSSVHLIFPQYTAQPATVPGNPYGLPYGTPYYVSVAEQDTEGSSNYNSLQASLIQAASHGLQYTLAYTWSHSLDDGSGYENAVGRQGRLRNYVPGFEYLNYGSSDFDARHRFAASYIYDIPTPNFLKSTRFLNKVVSDWEVAGVTALQTGFPVEIYEPSSRSLWCDGYSNFGCPDVPQVSSFHVTKNNPRTTGQYFDRSAFSAEPIGTFGNTSRNFFHGPGFNYTNLQVSRGVNFVGDGQMRCEFRIEAFNLFNHANFANPSGNFDGGSFGQVTSVNHSADPNSDPSPGRAIQLALKFSF